MLLSMNIVHVRNIVADWLHILLAFFFFFFFFFFAKIRMASQHSHLSFSSHKCEEHAR